METVGRLACRFGLSRSTLLYYDRLGLLRPSDRSPAGYRLYSEADVDRLRRILRYRDVGLPLLEIRGLLDSRAGSLDRALEARLEVIGAEIAALRRQQQVILRLLEGGDAAARARSLDKEGWTRLLRATGLDDDDMWRWHREFERQAPAAHHEFLESLGIDREEITAIRERSRG